MSRRTWNLDFGPPRGLYRDRENGWLFGVCAGLSERFNFRTGTVRLITVICLFLFFWPTVLFYVLATLIVKEKPLVYSGREREYDFWRKYGCDDKWSRS